MDLLSRAAMLLTGNGLRGENVKNQVPVLLAEIITLNPAASERSGALPDTFQAL